MFGPTPDYPLVESYINPNPDQTFYIAGPCSLESNELTYEILEKISPFITHFRGGVFRAGTYPSDNWGWKLDLLKAAYYEAKLYGLKNIVDVLDIRDIQNINCYADCFQVGARQAQHFALLKELGQQPKPVFIKRGTNMTFDEIMGSVEYVLRGGNKHVAIIERGSVSYLDHVRWELSVSMIAKIKQMTNIPIIVDASHGSGVAGLVSSLTLAGIGAGANGCLVECHPRPKESLSDAEQAISIEDYIEIYKKVRVVAACVK